MADAVDLIALIKTLAPQHDLPWELIAAICTVESSMDPWAARYEPAWKYLVGSEETLTATERTLQMTSFGLMQVMGSVAREHGYTGWLTRLCIPEVGLNYGMLHLSKYHAHWPDWSDTIAAYNAGSPRKLPPGDTYVNQPYVDHVYSAWDLFERQVQPPPPGKV